MKKLYTIFKDEKRLVVGILINNDVYYFQQGFASNEEAKECIIEARTKIEIEKHPNMPKSLAREFAECELESVIWGVWSV